MSEISDGGPAFPTPCSTFACDQGLTKREWFAGMALQGLLASPKGGPPDKSEWAKVSFEYADAMISVLEKGGGK